MYVSGVHRSVCTIFVFYLFPVLAASDKSNAADGRQGRDGVRPLSEVVAIIEEKCEEYAAARYKNTTRPGVIEGDPAFTIRELDCVQKFPHTSGTHRAEEKEYPHIALLGTGEKLENVEWYASGSLISDQFILSSVSHKVNATWAALGLLNKSSITSDKLNKNIFKITRTFTHEKYRANSVYDNIALHRLENAVTFSPSIRPICLYTSGEEIPPILRHQATVAGWGQTDSGNADDTDILRKGRIDFILSKQCATALSNDSWLAHGFNDESMICAGNSIADDITCVAQSGGPLQIPIQFNPCMWSQVGITAYGFDSCSDLTPTLYTKVSYYLQWIQSIVWPRSTPAATHIESILF